MSTRLLSRVAENVYWAGRYLERAEGTARIVREHTNLLVDIPISVLSSWEPLLAITGSRVAFDERYRKADEASVISFLVADRINPSSVLMSIEQARENLRTTREVLPREAWQAVNDLYLYAVSHTPDGVARRSRGRFLERVIGECQRVFGILEGTMSRDDAYELLTLGRDLERADMTTRVLDVQAGSLVGAAHLDRQPHDDVRWMSVLRSVSALQMFHRTARVAADGPAVVRFLLSDERFPRSVAWCLADMDQRLEMLPRWGLVSPACLAARILVADPPVAELVSGGLTEFVDEVQQALDQIHTAVSDAYFLSTKTPVAAR